MRESPEILVLLFGQRQEVTHPGIEHHVLVLEDLDSDVRIHMHHVTVDGFAGHERAPDDKAAVQIEKLILTTPEISGIKIGTPSIHKHVSGGG